MPRMMVPAKDKKVPTSYYLQRGLKRDFDHSALANGKKGSVVLEDFMRGYVEENEELLKKWRFKQAMTDLIQQSDISEATIEKFLKAGVSGKNLSKVWGSVDKELAQRILTKWFGGSVPLKIEFEGIPVMYEEEKKPKPLPESKDD